MGIPGNYADLLEKARADEGKADLPVACGSESCTWALCGYDCSRSGRLCEEACAASDRRSEAYVSLAASGAENLTRDSRSLPYAPVVSLTKVLIYGCDLWDFTGKSKQGLEIRYAEIKQGAFGAGQARDHGYEVDVYAGNIAGPGVYQASGFLSASSVAYDRGDYFYGETACRLDVRAEGDGLAGNFTCEVPNRQGASKSIKLTGAFGCPRSAMDLNIIKMPGA